PAGRVPALGETSGELGEPVGIDLAVVVGEGHDLPGGGGGPGVARRAEAAGFLADELHAGEPFRDEIAGAVGRAVVDHDDLGPGPAELSERVQAVADASDAIPAADDDGKR